MCDVRDVDVLIAIVSVIRPGASNTGRKTDFALTSPRPARNRLYPSVLIPSVLKSTFGVVAYEEHILQICEAFADMPAGRADILRRCLGKTERQPRSRKCASSFGEMPNAWGERKPEIESCLGPALRLSGLCVLPGPQHGLWRRGVPGGASQAVSFPPNSWRAVLTNEKGFYSASGVHVGSAASRHRLPLSQT